MTNKECFFRIGDSSLVERVVNPITIKKGSTDIIDIGRIGQRPSAREVLHEDLQIGKAYGSENLRNTHGEQFHRDNDKTVEKEVTTVEETPTHSDGREDKVGNLASTVEAFDTKKPNPASSYKKDIDIKSMIPADALNSLMKDYGGEYDKKDDTEEVDEQDKEIQSQIDADKRRGTSLKSDLDWVDNLKKAGVAREGLEGGNVVGHTKEGTPVYSSPEKEREKRKKLLRERVKGDFSTGKSGSGNYEDTMNMSDEEMAKKIKRGLHENSRGVMKKKKSELDDVYDLVKNRKGPGDQIEVEKGKVGLGAKNNSFVKAMGPGGVQFDFGNVTGNPIADTYNSIFQNNIDPTQAQIAEYQAVGYDKAVKNFIEKGETTHIREYSQEEDVGKSELTPNQVPVDYRKQFHETTVNIGGEIVKAQSETDKFVLEQHKEMFKSLPNEDGTVMDITGSGPGGVVIDAVDGKAYDIISGQEVKPK